ncbi:MAG TPA: metal ABC transporter substrate-binding protein [Gaiellales bacterium]|jgi:zinc/manganese transport system substrate-binding protein|nr:metal ABC transporter substrate-binding protein [Gaiellales bacterium]
MRRLGLLALSVLVTSACTQTALAKPPPGTIAVVATTTQMQDILRNVGGRRVHVVGILRPNVDPHDFEPTPSSVAALAHARLVVESGAGLDAWAGQLVEAAGSGAPVFAAAAGLPLRGDDPHWWGDPVLVERVATALGRRLGEVDPPHRAAYERSAARYAGQVARMDAANRRLIATVPPAERKLVTNHDAFGYLAARYGIRVVGSVFPALSSAAQPSARDVASLIDRIRAEHVRAVFTESSLDPTLERQIAAEAGVRVYADLYGDTLGPAGSPGATYLGMERWNVRAMVAGFLGRPPP